MKNTVDMTSVFCGAGGDAQGARQAGIEVKIATNHWQRAIETHAANFPKTEHICADVSQVDPKRWPSTQVAWFSPECPYHSNAAGRSHAPGQRSFFDPAVDLAAVRSRATMWEVCRFSEVHHYQVVIVENVTEVRKWRLFPAWLQAMRLLDYDYKFCYHNSQFFGVPQSRDRVYMVFWKKGMRKPNLDFRPDAYCVSCSKQVKAVQSWKPKCHSRKYGLHYIYCCPQCSERVHPFYTPAATVIDWADPGELVLKPGRNLAPATIEPCIHELMNEYVPEYYSWEWPNSDEWDREEIVYFIAHCLSCLAWTMNEGSEFAPLAEYTELEVKQWLEERNRKEARVVVRKNVARGQIVQLRMI